LEPRKIKSIEFIDTDLVYDIEVEHNHNYLITTDNIISHNSSKTFSVLQLIYLIQVKKKTPYLFSVVSETMPHLRKGAINDFKTILESDNLFDDNHWNKTESTYYVQPKNRIEFFSADIPGKVHGPARNGLFINECQNMSYDTVRQLIQRTDGTVFLDYNPTHDFWMDKILSRSDAIEIHSTYKDNDELPASLVKEIEMNINDAEWWQVYGLGMTGKREGLIYPTFELVDEMPVCDYSIGLDFGFNHPTALTKIGLFNNCIYIEELLYRSGLLPSDIASFCKDNVKGIVYADSARPESIEEIRRHGVNILPAFKGSGSVLQQISFIKKYPIKITKRSVNTINELRNYRWVRDKNNKSLDEPVKINDDAMDSFRYGFIGKWFQNISTFTGHKLIK